MPSLARRLEGKMTVERSLSVQDVLRAQTFLYRTLEHNVCVRYTLYRKDKKKQYEMMRADVVCVHHLQDGGIWNFARFGCRFEISSSVQATERTTHDKYFATPDREIIYDGVLDTLRVWEGEIEEGLHPKHASAQPEWLDVNAPFVGVLMIGDKRSELPASSSHWLLYHGLVMAKITEYRTRLIDSENENWWLEDILWTTQERFGAFVSQKRNEIAMRVFAG